MAHTGRYAAAVAALTLALAAGGTGWTTGARAGSSRPTTGAAVAAASQQPYGVDLTMETADDHSFCAADNTGAGDPSKPGVVEYCATADDQHWMFAHAADSSIVVIDAEGDCLDDSAGVGIPIKLVPCSFGKAQKFSFTTTGQVRSVKGSLCLEAAKAAVQANLFFDTCKSFVTLQRWQLAR